MTVRDYMDPALRARIGQFSPPPREFFAEVDYRDPEIMRTHGYHWFDKARMVHDPHPDPIRRGPLLYNIFITRTEGHATGWEEMMLHAGMFDARPRSRELIYVLLAQRAARAQGDLRMHARQATLEEASAWAAQRMREDGLDDVRLEPVRVPHWVRGTEWGRMICPVDRHMALPLFTEKAKTRRTSELGRSVSFRGKRPFVAPICHQPSRTPRGSGTPRRMPKSSSGRLPID